MQIRSMQGLVPAQRRQPKLQAYQSLRAKQNNSSAVNSNADLAELNKQVRSRTQLGDVQLSNKRNEQNNGSQQPSMQKHNQRSTENLGKLIASDLSPHRHASNDNGYFGNKSQQQQLEENNGKLVNKKVVSPPKIRDKLMGAKQRTTNTYSGVTEQGGFLLPTGVDDFAALVTSRLQLLDDPYRVGNHILVQKDNFGKKDDSQNIEMPQQRSTQQLSPMQQEQKREQKIQASGLTTVFKGSDRRRALVSTERKSSCHVDYSAMKPIQMMSGVSEDQTPQSQSKMLQPKGLQSIPPQEINGLSHEDSTSNELASLPQFRVLTSHYQEHKAIKQVVLSSQAETGERQLDFATQAREAAKFIQSQSPSVGNGIIFDSGDQGAEMQQMLLSQKSSHDYKSQPDVAASAEVRSSVVAPQATQYSQVKAVVANNLTITQKTPSASGNPSLSKGLPTMGRTGKKNTSEMEINRNRPQLFINGSRGEVTLAGGNDLRDSLKISPMLPKSKPTSAFATRQKASANSQVSDYNKMTFYPDKSQPNHKLNSNVRTPNTELGFRERKVFGQGVRNVTKVSASSNDIRNEWVDVKRFKSSGLVDLHERNVTSNNSWQSSNSVRLNQDILSAKIDSHGPEEPTINLGNKTCGIGFSKIQREEYSFDSMAINAAILPKTTEEPCRLFNPVGFATVDKDTGEMIDGAPSPLQYNKVVSPLRKSVLQRNSRKTLQNEGRLLSGQNGERISQDICTSNKQLLKHSIANTLQGTISSKDSNMQNANNLKQNHIEIKQGEQHYQMNIQDEIKSEYKKSPNQEYPGQPLLPIESLVEKSETLRRDETASIEQLISTEVVISQVVVPSADHDDTNRSGVPSADPEELNKTHEDAPQTVIALHGGSQVIKEEQLRENLIDIRQNMQIERVASHMLVRVSNEHSVFNDSQIIQEQRKQSSQEQMATSIGEESFIHPPSPIGMNRIIGVNKTFNILGPGGRHVSSEEYLSSDKSRIQAKGIHTENLPKIGEEQYIQPGQYHQECQSLNNDVVDVMHCGVDTQDFLELSGSENGALNGGAFQHIHQIPGIGQRKKAKKIKHEHKVCGGQANEKQLYENDLSMTGDGITAASLQQLRQVHQQANSSVPTISCLCKELEQTPEQFAQLMQRYRRHPRLILKSETDKNRVLLVTPDGTSKDQQMMECIIHNSMKIDGMSIPKVVAQHHEYFSLLHEMESTTEHKRKRVQMQIPTVNSPSHLRQKLRLSDAGDTLTNRTFERKQLMERQLAQFVQYGQEDKSTNQRLRQGKDTVNGNVVKAAGEHLPHQLQLSQASLQKRKQQLQVLHSKCEVNLQQPQPEGETGLYSPNLMQSQYMDDQSRPVSLANENPQMFYAGQIQSTQRGEISQSLNSGSHGNTKQLIQPTSMDPYGNKLIMTGIQYLNMSVSGQPQNSGRSYLLAKPTSLVPSELSQGPSGVTEEARTPVPRINDLNEQDTSTHCISWAKIPREDERDTAQFNSIKLDNTELSSPDKMIKGLVPTNIEIIRPQQTYGDNQERRMHTSQRHTNNNGAAYMDNHQNEFETKHFSQNNQQTYYLDNNFTRTSDEMIVHDRQSSLNSPSIMQSKKKDKFMKRYARGQKASHISSHNDASNYICEVAGQNTSLAAKRKRDPENYNLSNQVKNGRCTISQDNDISTQRRFSNNASRMHCTDLDEFSNAIVKDQQVSSAKLSARQDMQGRKSPTILRGNQRQAGAGGKRTSLGTWTAALCKMTPGQIELRVTSSAKNKRQQRQKSASYLPHSKEFQVVRSKQGMLAQISRSIRPAFDSRISNNNAIPHYMRQVSSSREHLQGCNLNDNTRDSANDSLPQQMKPSQPKVSVHRAVQKPSFHNKQQRQAWKQPVQEETLMIQSRTGSQNEQQNLIDGVTNDGNSYQDARVDTPQDIRNSKMFDSHTAISRSDQQQQVKTALISQENNTDTTIVSGNGEATDKVNEQIMDQQQPNNMRSSMRPSSNPFVAQRTNAHSYLQLPLNQSKSRPNQINKMSQGTLSSFGGLVDQMNQTNTSSVRRQLGQPQIRPQTRQPAVRITKSSCNPGRGSKAGRKSASLLKMNAQNQQGRSTMNRSRQQYLRDTFKQTPNNADQLSVEAIIKDLGDQKSELNVKMLKNVERRANFPASDYEWRSLNQGDSTTGNNMRQAQTGQNFFSWTNLRNSGGAFPNEGLSSEKLEMAETAEHSNSHHNMFLENEWTDQSQMGGTAVYVSGVNIQNMNEDLAASDPVSQLVAMSLQGQFTHQRGHHSRQANRKQVPSIQNHLPSSADLNNTRARILSHNKDKRQKMNQKAIGLYYNLRQRSHQRIDAARDMGKRFKDDDNSHLQSFKLRCGSKDMSPLGRYLEQKKIGHTMNQVIRPSTTSH